MQNLLVVKQIYLEGDAKIEPRLFVSYYPTQLVKNTKNNY